MLKPFRTEFNSNKPTRLILISQIQLYPYLEDIAILLGVDSAFDISGSWIAVSLLKRCTKNGEDKGFNACHGMDP